MFPFETSEMDLTVSRCTRVDVPEVGRVSSRRRSGLGGQFVSQYSEISPSALRSVLLVALLGNAWVSLIGGRA